MQDHAEIGCALLFAGLVALVLLPLISRVQTAIAFMSCLERGLR